LPKRPDAGRGLVNDTFKGAGRVGKWEKPWEEERESGVWAHHDDVSEPTPSDEPAIYQLRVVLRCQRLALPLARGGAGDLGGRV
jgi:hypothetical protein